MNNNGVKKYIHLFDGQIPDHIDLSPIESYMSDQKFHGIQYGGDWLDMTALQGWENKSPDTVDWSEIWEEIDIMNEILDKHQKILPKAERKFWMGNHEGRLYWFLEKYGPSKKNPYGTDWYRSNKKVIPDLEKELKLKERGFKVYTQYQLGSYGKLKTYHGGDYSDSNEKKNLQLYGVPIMYGHVHRPGRYTKVSPVSSDPVSAWSMPCLCNRGPRWKRGSPDSWSNGFGVSYVRSGGFFNLYTVDIVRGQFVSPEGKQYGKYQEPISRIH